MAKLLNVFVGVPQSKYAAVAVLVSFAAVGLAVLFSKERVPLTQKLVAVSLLFLLSLPAMLLTLFQLTCMVTGAGLKNQRWWCSGYAWLVSALIILYSILLVVMTVLSVMAESKSVKVEKFYSSRENFQEMAEDMMEEEEEGAGVVTMPPSEEEMPKVEATPELVPEVPSEEPEKVGGTNEGAMVAAMEPEGFTSCGAPWM